MSEPKDKKEFIVNPDLTLENSSFSLDAEDKISIKYTPKQEDKLQHCREGTKFSLNPPVTFITTEGIIRWRNGECYIDFLLKSEQLEVEVSVEYAKIKDKAIDKPNDLNKARQLVTTQLVRLFRKDDLKVWLITPNEVLQGRTPSSLLDTVEGCEELLSRLSKVGDGLTM